MDTFDSEWQRKKASFSHNTACKEYGLTLEEIEDAIRAGKLQYRQGSMHGNPFLRLLRREVEALVEEKHGGEHLEHLQAETELAHINRELKRLKKEIVLLEARKARLLEILGK
jgi:uncharacterized protein (DUF433 family)